jgi:hypothetical protein
MTGGFKTSHEPNPRVRGGADAMRGEDSYFFTVLPQQVGNGGVAAASE